MHEENSAQREGIDGMSMGNIGGSTLSVKKDPSLGAVCAKGRCRELDKSFWFTRYGSSMGHVHKGSFPFAQNNIHSTYNIIIHPPSSSDGEIRGWEDAVVVSAGRNP